MDKEAVGMERGAFEREFNAYDWRHKGTGEICAHFWQAGRAELRAALAQQPASQAAGLTDEQRDCVNSVISEYEGRGFTRIPRVMRELLSRAAPSGEPVAYVECRECGRCGHTGINDAHSQDECCSNCDWTGPAPKEDVCPGCAQTGTMRAACPKCGSMYRLLCETTVAAPQPSAQQAEQPAGQASALDVWNAVCDEAQLVVKKGKKHLLLTEDMCIRIGTAIEQSAAEARGVDRLTRYRYTERDGMVEDRAMGEWVLLDAVKALLAAAPTLHDASPAPEHTPTSDRLQLQMLRRLSAIINTPPGTASEPRAEGWKLVPVELTGEMVTAGKRAGGVPRYSIVASWGAMLAAAPTPPAGDIQTDSIDRLTREKAAHIIARDGFQVSGVVMTKPNGSVCIVDKSAVRWLDSQELFRVMHPDAPPAGDAGQERDWRDAERYLHVRAHGMPKLCPAGFYYHDGVFYPTADAAIDAYMAASKGEKA